MKKFKITNIIPNKALMLLSTMSFAFATMASRDLCIYFFHQPKAPAKLSDLKK